MPVTVNITFENWIFKWIPHLCDPSYQSHCGKRQCGTLKWILYFISILKKLCIFSLTIFFPLTLSTLCRKCFNINNTKQQGIHMRLSPFKCYNNMAKLDEQGFEKKPITFFSVVRRTCVSSCCRRSISLLAWCNWSWICCLCCLSVLRTVLVRSRDSPASFNTHSLICNWGWEETQRRRESDEE